MGLSVEAENGQYNIFYNTSDHLELVKVKNKFKYVRNDVLKFIYIKYINMFQLKKTIFRPNRCPISERMSHSINRP